MPLFPDAPPQEDAIVQAITRRAQLWEDTVGQDFRTKNQELYKQYRGFKEWQSDWIQAENDRDAVVPSMRKKWGAQLHIPLSFQMIETLVPRMIANQPKLTYLPRDERWRENVPNVQTLIDWQQEQIRIELQFQLTARNGYVYGIGVGKTFWDRKERTRQRMEERPIPLAPALGGDYRLSDPQPDVYFDGPRYANVDVGDFMWDPYGYDIESCDWTAQRLWLSMEKINERLQSRQWQTVSAQHLSIEKLLELPGSNQRYDILWRERMRESGFNTKAFDEQGEQIHELLEYHDGEMVYGILDRQILVSAGANPCGEMPFQIFRPIPLDHQFVGIGALEPLEHLQRELDTLRSQRRDSTTLALKAPTAYDDTAVDQADLRFSPTGLIPIDGDPRAAIMQLAPKEVPGTAFQEEQSIRGDIASVGGLADAPEATPNTATEAQLVQAQVSRRIELTAERFESEIVEPVACQFLYLDQREIRAARRIVTPTQMGQDQQGYEDKPPYKAIEIDPGALEGDFEIKVAKGSLAARNIPQDRADATQLYNMLAGDWYTNPTMVRERVYELLGIEHPRAWLRNPEPAVPLMALRFLVQLGYQPQAIAQSVIRAREVSAPQEGPEQVAEMSGGGGAPVYR